MKSITRRATVGARTRLWLGAASLLILWEIAARAGVFGLFGEFSSQLFPPASQVVQTAAGQIVDVDYWSDLGLTTARVLISFFVASVVGVGIPLAGQAWRALDDVRDYPSEFFRQLPAVAVMPLAIIALGIDSSMKIGVAVFGCVFPIMVGTREALRSVDPVLVETAKTYGWRGWRYILGVALPAAATGVLSAMRIALAISLILVVTTEMLVGGDGLGGRLVLHERAFETVALYANIMLLGILGTVLSQALGWGGRVALYWREDLA